MNFSSSTHIVLSSGPVLFTHLGEQFSQVPRSLEPLSNYSCWVWNSKGKLLNSFKALFSHRVWGLNGLNYGKHLGQYLALAKHWIILAIIIINLQPSHVHHTVCPLHSPQSNVFGSFLSLCRCLCSVLHLESQYPPLLGLYAFFPSFKVISDVIYSIRPTLILSTPTVKSQASLAEHTSLKHSLHSALSFGSLCTCFSLLLDS